MQFHALLEEWPNESMVFFQKLPGCFSSAPTTEDALRAAPGAVETYLRWLKKNNVVILEEVDAIEVVLSERLRSSGINGPLFQADRDAPDDLAIDNALNVAATARALVIEMVANVPEHLYEQQPASGGWSLTRHLRHIMECEDWYISRLTDQPAPELPTATLTTDEICMRIFERAMDSEIFLRDLTPEQRTRVWLHDDESWTAAKTLRRMAQHLREHYAYMEETIQQFAVNK
ncbi:MAG TPA: DinB family protein [Ktedonobacteraceae bacterium]